MGTKFSVPVNFVYFPFRDLTMASPPFCGLTTSPNIYIISMLIGINVDGSASAGLELLKEKNGELVEDSAAQRKPVLPRQNLFGPTLENPLLSFSVVLFAS